jgi:hypothetical protein
MGGEFVILTKEQRRERGLDNGQVMTLTKVEQRDDYFDLLSDGTGFGLRSDYGVQPKVGDVVTLYTRNFSTVRGVDLNGAPVFYKTEAELDEEHRRYVEGQEREKDERFEAEREMRDAAYDALPDVFKRRIAWFRSNNPRFRQDYEPYEMSSCTDAIKLAEWAFSYPVPSEAIKRFQEASYDEQKKTVPELDYDRHSGNSFGFVIRLAYHYVTEPENVYEEHGAMVPLVGCLDYGCIHPRG